jgi:uncharacterized protein YegJ (DUF2314 family)
VQSKDFDYYFEELHLTPGTLGLASLGCLLKPGRINPLKVFRGAKDRGIATASLRRRYFDLAQTGQIVMANTWMANSGLTTGEINCAPALLISGGDGTEEAEAYVQHILGRLIDISDRPPSTDEEREVLGLLDDEEYHVFRVRMLPLTFTENYPVYLFDTMLHHSVVAGGKLANMPYIICVVHPEMQPAILPVPISLVAPHLHTNEPSDKSDAFRVETDDKAMRDAMAVAKASLSQFWQVFEQRAHGETGFSLKARIVDENGVEHFWLTDIERNDGRILGRINNEPAVVSVVKLGDKVEIPGEIITDWLYLRNSKMVGNFTLRALFHRMPPEEVARYRQIMAD